MTYEVENLAVGTKTKQTIIEKTNRELEVGHRNTLKRRSCCVTGSSLEQDEEEKEEEEAEEKAKEKAQKENAEE